MCQMNAVAQAVTPMLDNRNIKVVANIKHQLGIHGMELQVSISSLYIYLLTH